MKREVKVFVFSMIINFFISILKIGGGLYFNFASLISDGMQTLSDFITDIVSFIGIKVSKKRPTKSHPFGFGKMEYIINLVIGVILLLLSDAEISFACSLDIVTILKIEIPHISNDEERKSIIDKYVKKFLAMRTEEFISNRLPYWSEKMKTKYNTVKVGDTTSQYGSCIPSKKALHFSNRLIMLPEDKIDAIIVHELSHMTHANHSPQFYNLVQKYIPNYFEIDKWLKENVNKVMI